MSRTDENMISICEKSKTTNRCDNNEKDDTEPAISAKNVTNKALISISTFHYPAGQPLFDAGRLSQAPLQYERVSDTICLQTLWVRFPAKKMQPMNLIDAYCSEKVRS
ncbi:hypothetical protein TNCV_559171 [Trichonephila clavipes]|nr:hypothetical protein TNCV_559171 [Trichonephila clavipes]